MAKEYKKASNEIVNLITQHITEGQLQTFTTRNESLVQIKILYPRESGTEDSRDRITVIKT